MRGVRLQRSNTTSKWEKHDETCAVHAASRSVAGSGVRRRSAEHAPALVSDLGIARSGTDVVLSRTHLDASIQKNEVWRTSNLPYGMPGAAGAFQADTIFPGARENSYELHGHRRRH